MHPRADRRDAGRPQGTGPLHRWCPGATVLEVDRRSAGLKAGAARPRLRRLTALTPSALRSVGLACARSKTERGEARCSAHCAAAGVPFLSSCDHDVDDGDELAHAGDKGDLLVLALGNQAIVEGLEDGIMPGRGA